jgi:hypothetical protein
MGVFPLTTGLNAIYSLFVLSGFLLGIGLVAIGISKYRQGAFVKNTPTQSIRGIARGRAAVQGTAHRAADILPQPFRDDTCLYYSYEIEEHTSAGTNSRTWRRIDTGADAVPFLVDDDTGQIPVDAQVYATWELTDEQTTERVIDRRETPPEDIASFCKQRDIEPVASQKRRYTQEVLPVSASVTVFGYAVDNPDTDSTDDDPANHHKLVRDASSGRFIISDMGSTDLRDYYRIRSPAYIAAGLLLSAVCLFVFLD